MHSHSLRVLRRHWLREAITLLLFASLILQSATAVAPDWWTTRSVFLPGATADDYAVANLGQLKTMASNAAQELDDNLANGAGDVIHALLDAWNADPADLGVTRDDYAALTVGQLKSVGQLFYDRLIAEYVRSSGSYPWTGTNADDYALANVGQLKHVFAFDTSFVDTNSNGIPDLWETQMFGIGSLNQSADGDPDGDGLSNLQEYLAGTDPTNADTDGDGWDDATEVYYYGSNSGSSNTPDANALVSMYGTYDADGLLADDGWDTFYSPKTENPNLKWYYSHTWAYLDPAPGGPSVGKLQSSKPDTTLLDLPSIEAIQDSEVYWWTASVNLPFSLLGESDADFQNATDFIQNQFSLPMINRWDVTTDYTSGTDENTGWGINWKRYRLRMPKALPVATALSFLQVTYKWDKVNLVWNQDPWDPYGDSGYWGYPEPTIDDVTSVQMTLPAGKTLGDWLYVCPQSDAADVTHMYSVHLVPVEVTGVFERDQIWNKIPNPKYSFSYENKVGWPTDQLRNILFVAVEPGSSKVEVSVNTTAPSMAESSSVLCCVVDTSSNQMLPEVAPVNSGVANLTFSPTGSVNDLGYEVRLGIDKNGDGALSIDELLPKSTDPSKTFLLRVVSASDYSSALSTLDLEDDILPTIFGLDLARSFLRYFDNNNSTLVDGIVQPPITISVTDSEPTHIAGSTYNAETGDTQIPLFIETCIID